MAILQKIYLISFFFIGFSQVRAQSPGKLQPQKLETKVFKVCGKQLSLEVADSDEERSVGLMHREGIPQGTGMIFIFEDDSVRHFWMRHVPFDIDIGYFDSKGKLVKALTMLGTSPLMADDRLPRYSSEKPARFAIEVEKGFFAKIKKSSSCKFSPLPSL
jgi:uncharacterized membrane protein (UPF0127 family)